MRKQLATIGLAALLMSSPVTAEQHTAQIVSGKTGGWETVVHNNIEEGQVELFVLAEGTYRGRNELMYVVDTDTLSTQQEMFERMSLATRTVESDIPGFGEHSVMNVNNLTPYLDDHHYTSTALVDFFNQHNTLTDGEELLLDVLLHNQVLREEDARYAVEKEAIVSSISMANDPSFMKTRRLDLYHFVSHAMYAGENKIAQITEKFWDEELTNEDRLFFTRVLSAGYRVSDKQVLLDEFQAHVYDLRVMQRQLNQARFSLPIREGRLVRDYLNKHPERVQNLRRAFIDYGKTFLQQHK